MNIVRVWRYPNCGHWAGALAVNGDAQRNSKHVNYAEAYRALPVADFDALTAQLAALRAERDEAVALLGEAKGEIEVVDACPDHTDDDPDCLRWKHRRGLLSRITALIERSAAK